MNWIGFYKFLGPYIMLLGMLLVLIFMDLFVAANPVLLISKIPIVVVGILALAIKIKWRKADV